MQTNVSGGNNAETNAMVREPDLTCLGLTPQPACRRFNEQLPSLQSRETSLLKFCIHFLFPSPNRIPTRSVQRYTTQYRFHLGVVNTSNYAKTLLHLSA